MFHSKKAVIKDEAGDLARETLAHDKPALIRATDLEGGISDARVFVTARHAVLTAVLCDEATFSVRHYDRRMETVAGPIRLFLTQDSAARSERIAILLKGQSLVARRIGAGKPSEQFMPAQDNEYLEWIAAVVREEARAALNVLRQRKPGDGDVNFVREYCFLIAHRCTGRIFGIRSPGLGSRLGKGLAFMRNLMAPGRPIVLKGELGDAMAQLGLYQVVLGYLFSPPKEGPVLRLLARFAAAAFRRGLEADLSQPATMPPESLMRAIIDSRDDFPDMDDEQFRLHLESIAFELPGSMTLLVGLVSSLIASLLYPPLSKEHEIGWREFMGWMRGKENGHTTAHLALQEAFRLVGQTRMLRTVERAIELDGVALQVGDIIYAFPDIASNDPGIFADANQITLDPARIDKFVNFGPWTGPHRCYGQFIARTMIREILLAADGLLIPRHHAELQKRSAFPDDFTFHFTASDGGKA